MTHIDIFDTEAKRIKELSKRFEENSCFDEGFVMEAIFDLIDHEAHLYGISAEDLISRYMGV